MQPDHFFVQPQCVRILFIGGITLHQCNHPIDRFIIVRTESLPRNRKYLLAEFYRLSQVS